MTEMALDKKLERYYYGTGRRKNAVARVRVFKTPGDVLVNDKTIADFLSVDAWVKDALRPLEVVALKDKVTVTVKTHGGGTHGQAGAICHGIARALVVMDETLRPALKKAGLLTRDPRMRESKKYGLKRARKAPQYTKR